MKWLEYIILINILGTLPIIAFGQDECEMVEDYDGIRIYECQLEHSDFNSVKADFEIDATLAQYAYLVLTFEHYPVWNHEAKNARLLEQISPTELIYYTQVDAPWPIQDRDIILHLKVIQNPRTKVLNIQLTSMPDKLPEYEDFIRIHDYWSTLKVIPITTVRSKVEYYLELNPGGDVPPWFVNLICSRIPMNTFLNFREGLKMFTHKNIRYESIVNR